MDESFQVWEATISEDGILSPIPPVMPPEANEVEINGQESGSRSVETEQADKEQLEMPLSRAGPSSVGAKKRQRKAAKLNY